MTKFEAYLFEKKFKKEYKALYKFLSYDYNSKTNEFVINEVIRLTLYPCFIPKEKDIKKKEHFFIEIEITIILLFLSLRYLDMNLTSDDERKRFDSLTEKFLHLTYRAIYFKHKIKNESFPFVVMHIADQIEFYDKITENKTFKDTGEFVISSFSNVVSNDLFENHFVKYSANTEHFFVEKNIKEAREFCLLKNLRVYINDMLDLSDDFLNYF